MGTASGVCGWELLTKTVAEASTEWIQSREDHLHVFSVATGRWRRGTSWSHPTHEGAKTAVIGGSDAIGITPTTGLPLTTVEMLSSGRIFLPPPPPLASWSSVISRSCQHLHGSLDQLSSRFIPQLLIPGLRPRQMAAVYTVLVIRAQTCPAGARRRRCKSAPPSPL